MISSFQNFSDAAQFAGYGGVPGAMYSPGGGVANPMYGHHHGQLQSVYSAVAASAQQAGVYNAAGQQPVPYHPAEYGGQQPAQLQLQSSPYMPPSRYHEPPRPSATTTELPNRKKPASASAPSQQSSVQYTRVQAGVSGGTIF